MIDEHVHAAKAWDIPLSLLWTDKLRKFDPDLGQPGWCWNSAMMVSGIIGRRGTDPDVTYVEGWLHNRLPLTADAKRRYPHAWTVLSDGRIIDTTSGATECDYGTQIASLFIFYEPVNVWTYDELMEALEPDPTPPLTPHFVGWTS